MNRAIVTLIPAGSAACVFPVITPVTPDVSGTTGARTGPGSVSDLPRAVSSPATTSPAPDAGQGKLGAAADALPRSPQTHVLTAGLVAAALAIMLAATRLSLRRRTAKRGRRT